ncbi:MAG: 1-acyl-sn-glycerol-3-phosphate acyltransferase [Elusimicrobia bacterium]|nr:1-acyl-sn-glycerol-3-phosphate acyltransferase [Elusimicrobiota bacterium]
MRACRWTWLRRLSYGLVEALARTLWPLKVSGLEHVPGEGPLIVASNHVSLCDGPMLSVALGDARGLRFLAKAELFKVPGLGCYLSAVGNIPVDRSRGDVAAMRAAVTMVRSGGCLGMFPEGTRGKGQGAGTAKPGVGFLARETGAPVVPARVVNTDRFPMPHRVEVRFGPPMVFQGDPEDKKACRDFAEELMERIRKL